MAARIRMIATTIRSSINEKPRRSLRRQTFHNYYNDVFRGIPLIDLLNLGMHFVLQIDRRIVIQDPAAALAEIHFVGVSKFLKILGT